MPYSNGILPGEIVNFLVSQRDLDTQGRFRVGDLANDVCDELCGYVTKQAVYAEFAYYRGKSARTIRYWSEVARIITHETRANFPDLSFAHFAFACQKRFVDTNRVYEVLEWASVNNASPDKLNHYYSQDNIGNGNVGNVRSIVYSSPSEFFTNVSIEIKKIASEIGVDKAIEYTVNLLTSLRGM